MMKGELPHQNYYIVPDKKHTQNGEGGVTMISPTTQQVEHARMLLKRKIEETNL